MKNNKFEQFCDSWLQAWTGNRPKYLLSFYADDAYYQDPAHPNGLKGHAALTKYFSKLLAKNPEWVWKREELFPTERGFILKWCAEIPIVYSEVLITGMDLVELQEEKITRNEVYFDTRLLG